jgi:hypothetical protein
LKSHGDEQTKFSFPLPISYSLQRCLWWRPERSGRQVRS